MKFMKTIFVPVDYSRSSNAALRSALSIAKTTSSRLIIFHCYGIPDKILMQFTNGDNLTKMLEQAETTKLKALLIYVYKICKKAGMDKIPANVKCIVKFNNMPAETINLMATHNKADLIVMGTHGTNGIKKWLFGTTTATLIRDSTIPVLAIPEGNRKKNINSLCLASNLLNLENELKIVSSTARFFQASLSVLHFNYNKGEEGLVENAISILKQKRYENISFITRTTNVSTPLTYQLQNEIRKSKYDCLVMFPRDRGFWDRLLTGSKTEEMASLIKIPFLSIHIK